MTFKLSLQKKRTSRFARGTYVPCIILDPGERSAILTTLRKEEKLLTNKTENQKFLIVESPCIEVRTDNNIKRAYVCDVEKGVTVSLSFVREAGLSSLFCDPKMVSNVFDETFISKASGIKPDFKQLMCFSAFGFIMGGFLGLLF